MYDNFFLLEKKLNFYALFFLHINCFNGVAIFFLKTMEIKFLKLWIENDDLKLDRVFISSR